MNENRVMAPREVVCDKKSFDWFCRLAHISENKNIELDCSNLNFFYGNMCAVFGSILDRNKQRVTLLYPKQKILDIFSRNGFMKRCLTADQITDTKDTTIEYRSFQRNDFELFGFYYLNHYKHALLPEMSEPVKEYFKHSIFEIFGNCVDHSNTGTINICGQFFPTKEKLLFTITDIGIGFKESFRKHLGRNIDSIEAITQATQGVTTKRENPGGLGLKMLVRFIKLNEGRLVIVSGDGYWELKSNNEVLTHTLSNSFPGSIVTIEIDTADNKSYCLS